MDPLRPLKLHPGLSPRELLEQMEGASFGARSLGHAWRVLRTILDDSECRVLLTVSGALSVAQLGGIFRAMLARKILHAVVTTGAVVTHQVVQELNLKQFRLPAGTNDISLSEQGLHRIYDSLEPETNLEALARFVVKVSSQFTGPLGSAEIIPTTRERVSRSQWLARGISSAKRASVRNCSHRLRAWSRPLLRQRPIEATSLSLRSDGGSRRSWRMDPEAEADRSDHARRWCATQLGNADDSIPQKPGMSQAASRGRRHSCLPRSRRIRSLVRKHLFRGDDLGQARPTGSFELRRGARRRRQSSSRSSCLLRLK